MVAVGKQRRPGVALMAAVGLLVLGCNSTRHSPQHAITGSGGSASGAGTGALPMLGGAGGGDAGAPAGGTTGVAGDTSAGAAGNAQGGTGGEAQALAATLSKLGFSNGELSPPFEPHVESYTLEMAPLMSKSVSVTAATDFGGAQISLNEGEPAAEPLSTELDLAGVEQLTFDVSAPGHSSKRYEVHVEHADLSALTIEHLRVAASPSDGIMKDAHAWDAFGSAVAIGTGWVALGGPGEDLIGGTAPQQNNAGAVDILEPHELGGWYRTHRLRGSARIKNGGLGASLAADGDVLLIGAPGEVSNPSLDLENPDFTRGGAAYVYRRGQGGPPGWQQVARLSPMAPLEGERFGQFVAVRGDTIAIGSNGVDVHVFHQTGVDTWEHEKTITDTSPTLALALTDEYLAVSRRDRTCGASSTVVYEKGAARSWMRRCTFAEDAVVADVPKAAALDGDSLAVAGDKRIFTYKRASMAWNLTGIIMPVETSFGGALVLASGRLFVGAPNDASPALGINGDAADQSSSAKLGAVYFFRFGSDRVWHREAYIKPGGVGAAQVAGAGFGRSLAFDGQMLVVGAPYFDASVAASPPEEWVAPVAGDPAGGAFFYR